MACLGVCPRSYSQGMWPSHALCQLAVSYLEVSGYWGNQTLPSSYLEKEGRRSALDFPDCPRPWFYNCCLGGFELLCTACLGGPHGIWQWGGTKAFNSMTVSVFSLGRIRSWALLWCKWMCPLLKFTWWNPNPPKMMVWGGGDFGRCLSHDGGALVNGITAL